MGPATVIDLAAGIGRARSGLHQVTRLVRQDPQPHQLPGVADELHRVGAGLAPLAVRSAEPLLGAGVAYAADARVAAALIERSTRLGVVPATRDVGQLLARVELLAAHVASLG